MEWAVEQVVRRKACHVDAEEQEQRHVADEMLERMFDGMFGIALPRGVAQSGGGFAEMWKVRWKVR